MKTLAVMAALTLSGCANYSQMRTDLDSHIADLKGRNIEVAIDRMGIPTNNQPLGDTTVYVWTMDNVFSGVSPDEQPLRCDLRLRADAAGRILAGDFDGNNGACMELKKKLFASH